MQDNVYFANLPPDELGQALITRVQDYYDAIDRNGRLNLWKKCHRAYYGLDSWGKHDSSALSRDGEQGELHRMRANHFRNLLQHLHVLVTQQRPSFECRALNTDYKSQTQTILGSNILEYYMREKRLADHFRRCVEFCIVYAEGYMALEWDPSAGDDAEGDIETGEIIKTGDIKACVYSPIDVIRRIRGDADTQQDWHIIRKWVNRFDLAAQYPDFEDEILNEGSDPTVNIFSTEFYIQNHDEDDDLVPVYYFFHNRTAACPEGKYAVVLGSGELIGYDDRLRYPVYPVFRMAAYNQDGTSFGYSVAFDLLGVQDAIDNLYSTVLSNQMAFGVQNIWIKPGTNFSPAELAGGLNVLESTEKPEPINLTNTPAEIFNFLRGLEGLGETLSGVNSVARGQPEASLKSGSALALVASQAVQFSNGIQAAYSQTLEDVGTGILKILQTRAVLPRATVIAGKDKRSYVKEFTGDGLKSINRVIVEMGNPVSRTVAGRIELANQLLQSQLLKNPEQYIQVVTTGNISPIIDDQESESLNIQRENEELRDGKSVPVTAIDYHVEHIKGHRKVLADPDARRDAVVVQTALAHIQEHINALRTVDPNLLNLLGMNPITQPDPRMAGAMAPQPNAAPVPGQEAPMPNQAPVPPNTPPEVAAAMPEMPVPPPVPA